MIKKRVNKSKLPKRKTKSKQVSKKRKTNKKLGKLCINKFKKSKKRTKKKYNRKKNYNNIMNGGRNLSFQEIKDKYYLCTQSRYDKPIDNMLRPFGSLEEVSEIYSQYPEELEKIKQFKKESDEIKDVQIVGSSQFGLYFRFVEKELIDNIYTKYNKNSDNFSKIRSFIFDIEKLLKYINKNQKNIPLCWFAGFNAYGYQKYWNTVLFNQTNMNSFLKLVGELLLEHIDDHEFVSRIPIPLSKESGFIGKINSSILYIYHDSDDYYSDDYYLRYSDNYCNKNKKKSDCLHKDKLKYCEWNDRTNKCFIRKKPWK